MEIAKRQTKQGALLVTLAGVDVIGATVDATLDGQQKARGARVVPMPPALRKRAPAEYSHLFYATDGSQSPIPLLATEMAPVLAQIDACVEDNVRRARAVMPVHRDRGKVERLFYQAARFRDDPGRYFPTLLNAQEALTAWRTMYPDAAREEDRQTLLAEAEELEHKAAGALVYDADGWLQSAEQERRATEYRAQAQRKREEAARL